MNCSSEYVDGYYYEEKIKSADIVVCQSFNIGDLFGAMRLKENLLLGEKDHPYASKVQMEKDEDEKPMEEKKTIVPFLEEYGLNPTRRLQRARQRNLILRIRRYEKKTTTRRKKGEEEKGKRGNERARRMEEKDGVGRKSITRS